jgi:hypothetical protein
VCWRVGDMRATCNAVADLIFEAFPTRDKFLEHVTAQMKRSEPQGGGSEPQGGGSEPQGGDSEEETEEEEGEETEETEEGEEVS